MCLSSPKVSFTSLHNCLSKYLQKFTQLIPLVKQWFLWVYINSEVICVNLHITTQCCILTHFRYTWITVENIMRKGVNACNKQFLLFSQCFLSYMSLIFHSILYVTYFSFQIYSKMTSAICFNLDQSKILSSGNGLRKGDHIFCLSKQSIMEIKVTFCTLPTLYDISRDTLTDTALNYGIQFYWVKLFLITNLVW